MVCQQYPRQKIVVPDSFLPIVIMDRNMLEGIRIRGIVNFVASNIERLQNDKLYCGLLSLKIFKQAEAAMIKFIIKQIHSNGLLLLFLYTKFMHNKFVFTG